MGKVIYLESHKKKGKKIVYKHTIDYPLMVALILLLCIGLVMVFSSSYYAAEFRSSTEGDTMYYFIKQLVCVLAGICFMVFFMLFDYHNFYELDEQKFKWLGKLKKIPLYWVIIVFAFLTLLLVWTPLGVDINGSHRWINIGISIQPSEIVKFGMIVFIACSIGRAPRRVNSFKGGILPYLILLLCMCIPIYFQPNFSAIVCLAGLVIIMLYLAGCNLWQLLGIVLVGGVLVFILAFAREYRQDRIEGVQDPLSTYQLKQSMFSLGTGGLFGKGLGNSLQKLLWLPMSESDFIFAIIAEELGFAGALAVLLLYAFIIWRGVRIAMYAPDLTGMLLASGVVAIITIQVVFNIAVVTGLIPTTGIVLPFISYGGSSVLVFMMMMGVLMNVSRQCGNRVSIDPEHFSELEEAAQPSKDVRGDSARGGHTAAKRSGRQKQAQRKTMKNTSHWEI